MKYGLLTAWDEHCIVWSKMYGRVLDAGCSNGEYSRRLEDLEAVEHVVSLDIQPSDVAHHGSTFKENCPDGDFVLGDVEHLPFPDDDFDCVFSWDMLQNVRGDETLIEFARVTKPGGLVTVRTVMKHASPWVTVGVTTEKGSSGYEFLIRTMWDPVELIRHAQRHRLSLVIPVQVDPWSHMVGLFMVAK